MSGLRGYDAWLERPYQERYTNEPPPEIEELLDARVVLDGEVGKIETWEPWEDADEDGRHGGVDLVVRWESGRTSNLLPDEAEEAMRRGIYDVVEEGDVARVYKRRFTTELDGTPHTPELVFTGTDVEAYDFVEQTIRRS